MELSYPTRKQCPRCDQSATRSTEVKRGSIITGYYLCSRGHSWETKWSDL